MFTHYYCDTPSSLSPVQSFSKFWNPLEMTVISIDRIPRVYRYFFLYVEPFSALIGAYYSCFQQILYLELTHKPTAPNITIPLSTEIVLTQLANLYLLFALNEAVVLRATRELMVWRALLCCLLIADFGHLYSVHRLGLHIYWRFWHWNAIDWGNIAFVYAGATIRLCFLFGLGIGETRSAATVRNMKDTVPSS